MKFNLIGLVVAILAISLSAFTTQKSESVKSKQSPLFWYAVNGTETQTVGSALNGGNATEKSNMVGGSCNDQGTPICYAGFSTAVGSGYPVPGNNDELIKHTP